MKRKTVYKIVSIRGHRGGDPANGPILTSGYIWGVASCQYARGLRTTGIRGTPVLAFSSLQAARAWGSKHAYMQIWRALAEEPVKCSWIGTFNMTLFPDQIEAFWSERGLEERAIPAPAGTVACKSIELVKRVGP